MIDSFTKWPECIPIPTNSIEYVLPAFISSWICRFGVPEVIVNDNDKTLTSSVIKALHRFMGTKDIVITPYHPEGNALIESFHRVLNKGLSCFEAPGKRVVGFNEALQLILYSYRSTIHSTTNETPAFLTYGIDLRPPQSNDWRFLRDFSLQQRLKFLNEMRLEIQWRAYEQRCKTNDRRNVHRQPMEFEINQLVLVKSTDYDKKKYAYLSGDHQHKLIPKWSMPARVIEVFPNKKSARVKDLITSTVRTVHISNVRLISPPLDEMQRYEWQQIIASETDGMFDPIKRREILEEFWEAMPEATEGEQLSGEKITVPRKRVQREFRHE
jgi:hypothetical protein